MPTPRLHPFIRLCIAVLGVVTAQGLLLAVISSALITAARLSRSPAPPPITEFVSSHAFLIGVLAVPPMVVWLYFCRRIFDRRSFVSLGLRARRCVRDTLLGAMGGAAAIALLFGLLYLLAGLALGHPPVISWSPQAFDTAPLATLWILLVYAGAFSLLGFMEEISFRGYGFHNLAAWMGTRSALIAQAIVFALVHILNLLAQPEPTSSTATYNLAYFFEAVWDIRWGLVNIALIGVFFALCYLKTGSLWFPIGFHVSWNFFQGCIFSLPVSGIDVYRLLDTKEVTEPLNAFLSGGAFGGEGSVLLVPIISGMIYLLWQQPDHPQAHLDLSLLNPSASAATNPWPAMTTPPLPGTNGVPEDETSSYASIKTTLRGLRNGSDAPLDEDEMPLSLGVIPRPAAAPAPEPVLTSELSAQPEPATALLTVTPPATTPEPASTPAAPAAGMAPPPVTRPIVTVPEPPPIVARPATAPSSPAPLKPSPPSPPPTSPSAPRKPPAPRW